MPERFPFGIGLDISQLEIPAANTTGFSSYPNMTFNNDATGYNGTKIGLSEPELQDGVFVSDTALKQVYIPMTVFQAFPVVLKDGTLTYVSDGVANSTTRGGYLAGGRLRISRLF